MTRRAPKKPEPEAPITIIRAMRDNALFSRWFKDPATWVYWSVFLSALFGLPLDPASLEIFTQCTGRSASPLSAFTEAWLIVGRRGGKSIVLALVAVFLAVFKDWSDRLVPGERGTVLVIAADRRQARVIFRYITALITETPLTSGLVDGEPTQDRIDLTNGISIEISTANFRTVRGYTLIACLCDEIAFWMGDDSANPDTEILAAIRPAMTTMLPDAMLLCASSPHVQRGALYTAFKKYYGHDDAPVLVWRATTLQMNPSVPQSVVTEAYERDAANAAAEYDAQFRTDIESFVSREVAEAALVPDRHELPRTEGVGYVAFVDPSGGSADSMTLAIAHMEGDRAILDLVRERRPPFSPDDVAKEFADTVKSYGIASARGDRFGGLWPAERLAAHGVEYHPAVKVKSDLYLTFLPLLNSRRVELLDNPRLLAQLCALERRTARGGRDSVDHAVGAHDDLINAAVGAVVLAAARAAQTAPLATPVIVTKHGELSATDPSDRRPPRAWIKGHQGEPYFDVTEPHHWGPVSTGGRGWGPV
jgi:hypothetical protein